MLLMDKMLKQGKPRSLVSGFKQGLDILIVKNLVPIVWTGRLS